MHTVYWTVGISMTIRLFSDEEPSAHALVPSQIRGVARRPLHLSEPRESPTKLGSSGSGRSVESDCNDDGSTASGGDEVVYAAAVGIGRKSGMQTSKNAPDTHRRKKKDSRTTTKRSRSSHRTGDLPDVYWRSIPMSHLRLHPNFVPLPLPSQISELPTKEHVRYFRQDSWQWDFLHQGRCTTSQSSAALGFLEPKAASFLGIPKSLRRGGVGAWHRLSEIPDEWSEDILCEGSSFDSEQESVWREYESANIWTPASCLSRPFPFAAKYLCKMTKEELVERKEDLQRKELSVMRTRMSWGNSQEATSILTALNYFCKSDDDATIHEVGMCGAGFDDNEEPLLRGLKLGASPDGIICHGDGTVEVLEVKNHCPFNINRVRSGLRGGNSRNKGNKSTSLATGNYLIRDFELEARVPPQYIPQLMMEILCVGSSVNLDDQSSQAPVCQSAVMVRQTATRGAILLRLQRDEEFISEMLFWLGEFKSRFVDTGCMPKENFFWSDDPSSRYRKFLDQTKRLSESVTEVATIDNSDIQRQLSEKGRAPLFLDRVNQY